jgi:hypothetical protein
MNDKNYKKKTYDNPYHSERRLFKFTLAGPPLVPGPRRRDTFNYHFAGNSPKEKL